MPPNARRLLIASTNRDKLREIQLVLAGLPVELATLDRWAGLEPPEETGRTFEENARLKARYYAVATGWTTIGEDSGLEIEALGRRPGVESARFGGAGLAYPAKFDLIYRLLAEAGRPGSAARFVCAVAVADGDRILFEGRGFVEGAIADSPRGEGGFGYDPIFFYSPWGCTLAEVSDERKAQISHRGRAFRALRSFLEK